MKNLAIAISLGALAVAGISYAQTPGSAGADRTVSRADALERAARMFDRADVNKDGKLDAGDREARRTAAFDRIDANHDGAISRAEFTATGPGMRRGMERRGAMEGGEHEGMDHKMGQGMHMGMGGGMGGGMGRGQRGGMGRGMMLRMADADRDGTITKAEFTAAAATRFDRTDANHDGQITRDERQAARAQMRERMRDMIQRRGQAPGNQPPVN